MHLNPDLLKAQVQSHLSGLRREAEAHQALERRALEAPKPARPAVKLSPKTRTL